MARTEKGKSVAIDNIAVGSAITSVERTIAGALPPDFTAIGNAEKVTVGNSYGTERHISGSTAPSSEKR